LQTPSARARDYSGALVCGESVHAVSNASINFVLDYNACNA
jgi:hypothetical protein